MARFVTLLAAVLAVAGLDGCDATGVRAQFENLDNPNVVVYAMNGTDGTLPSALLIRSVIAVPITADFGFDVAFDIDDTGAVIAHSVRKVAAEFVSSHRVGLALSEHAFDSVTTAAGIHFAYDTSLTVPLGKTVVVDAIDPTCSVFSLLGQDVYAKFVIDSVHATDRKIFLHLFGDPNCGFRSLAPGTPRE
ncbi:MAG TPA: hypothetical protein VJ867_14775 [Gemmatimonadaceae bacterium]|nr:hypothetical protein [Gemmatimonadaceae bacterium]